MASRPLITETTLSALLLHAETRAQLISSFYARQAERELFSIVAPRMRANANELREIALQLLEEDPRRGVLDDLLLHPDVPDDALHIVLDTDACIDSLGHRRGPRSLLERLANDHDYAEAIVTLASEYYAGDSDEAFEHFIFRHRACAMLRGKLRKMIEAPSGAGLGRRKRRFVIRLLNE